MADNNTNNIIAIVGAVVFALLAIIVPVLKILGGFLQYSIDIFGFTTKIDYYWDVVTTSFTGIAAVDVAYADMDTSASNIAFIWGLIPIWGLIWLGLGLLGAVLVLIPPLMKVGNMEPIGVPLGLIGLIAGLVATVVEYGLFFLVNFMEDWGGLSMNLNIILLGCFVIGWVGLIVGYYYPTKE